MTNAGFFLFKKECMKSISVIGLGLIGGSIGKELVAKNIHVIGTDLNPEHASKALAANLVSEILPFDEAVIKAEVIAICVPVDRIEALLPKVLDRIGPHQLVFDVGSTKHEICVSIKSHRMRNRYVAAHPLAGTEQSGPEAAHLGLFQGKKNIICDSGLSDGDAVDRIKHLFKLLGMDNRSMDSTAHDRHMAFVSHLSHVSSFALSQTVLDIEKEESTIADLASTGFASTARLARCNPETWTAIFSKNSAYLSQALDSYIRNMQSFKKLVDEMNSEGMHSAILKANAISRVLSGINSGVS